MSIPAVDPLTTPILSHDEGPEGETEGFDRPWNPWALVLFTLVFGLVGGGGLLAFNYKYLGMRGRTGWALAGVLFASVLIACGVHWANASGLIDPQDTVARRGLMIAGHIVSLLVAVAMAASQNARWREFRSSGGVRGKLLVPGVLAVVVSAAVQVVLSNAAWLVLNLVYGQIKISR